jgi:hypothetical protein
VVLMEVTTILLVRAGHPPALSVACLATAEKLLQPVTLLLAVSMGRSAVCCCFQSTAAL